MYRRFLLLLIAGLITVTAINAQSLRIIRNALHHDDESWYGSAESLVTARNVLLLQKNNGGWPKNIHFYNKQLSDSDISEQLVQKKDTKDATIDNGATYSEMLFLANMYQATRDDIYREAFVKGLSFLFSMQYENGGFRQFDRKDGYYTHITFNDNAMSNVLQLMRAVGSNHSLFNGMVSDSLRCLADDSFKRGIACILKTQYLQNGKRTIWCAQHDENTFLPAKARAYELPSLSGAESVNLVVLLMELPNPDQCVKDAIVGAMDWFGANRITDKRLEWYVNAEGQRDVRMINSREGNDLWGRFCDLETNRPFVCDRDGIIKYDLSEIGYERRVGYGWFTDDPGRLFPRYERWKQKHLVFQP